MEQSKFNLSYLILYVNDVEAMINFYKTTFGLETRFAAEDHTYAELNSGGTALAFAQHKLAGSNLSKGYLESDPKSRPFGFEIGITCRDVDAAMKKAISNGATLAEPVKVKPWGQTVGYIRDPEGFLVEVCTPME
jgi:lactoylglutathione lyase